MSATYQKLRLFSRRAQVHEPDVFRTLYCLPSFRRSAFWLFYKRTSSIMPISRLRVDTSTDTNPSHGS